MKSARFLLTALVLATGLMPAAAQQRGTVILPPQPRRSTLQGVPPPPGSETEARETPLLGANYRIVLSAASGGRSLGQLSVQTCAASFAISGSLAQPEAEEADGAGLSLHGELSEQEGGALRLRYTLGTTARMPSHWIGAPDTPYAAGSYTSRRLGGKGMLLLLPAQSCELMQISGVTYSLTITPMETWPVAPAPANAKKQAAAEPEEKPAENKASRGPSEEDRRRYESLSDRAKEKFRETLREIFSREEFRNSPEEERRARIKKAFDDVEAEDKARSK